MSELSVDNEIKGDRILRKHCRDYLVALVSGIHAPRLKQATRGDTGFRCQTHLAATNANLRASPAAVSSASCGV